MSDTSFDDILSDKDLETSEAAESEKAETEESEAEEPKAAEPKEEQGEQPEEGSEETGKDNAPMPGEDEPKQVPLASYMAEKTKRQELEKQLAEKDPPNPRPDALEDPEGAVKHVEQTLQGQLSAMRADMSLAMAREMIPDFDEVMGSDLEDWRAWEGENPALAQQVYASPLPGKAAYDVVKRLKELESIGNPKDFEAKIRADERAKVEKELEVRAKAETAEKAASLLPETLAGAASKGERKGPDWSGATPMEDILG